MTTDKMPKNSNRTKSAAKQQKSPRADRKLSISTSKLPNEGTGSLTPRPKRLKLASARMNTGTAIQNCAATTGIRLGATCADRSLTREIPAARADRTNSASRSAPARANMTLAGTPQPKRPSMVKVIAAETAGDVFNGSSALMISSRNSHGSDSIRSIKTLAVRSPTPPANPGNAPNRNASIMDNAAAAGASVKESRVQ